MVDLWAQQLLGPCPYIRHARTSRPSGCSVSIISFCQTFISRIARHLGCSSTATTVLDNLLGARKGTNEENYYDSFLISLAGQLASAPKGTNEENYYRLLFNLAGWLDK
jgi:hypothetical protein